MDQYRTISLPPADDLQHLSERNHCSTTSGFLNHMDELIQHSYSSPALTVASNAASSSRRNRHCPPFAQRNHPQLHRFISFSLCLVLFCSLTPNGSAVRFYLHDHERRCFRFESEYDSLVNAYANVANGAGSADLSVEIRDSRKHIVYQTHSISNKHSSFSFRTPKFDPAHMDRDIEEEEEEMYDYDPREMEGWFEACLVLSLSDRSSHDPNAKRAVSFWVRPHEYHDDSPHDTSAKASDEQVKAVSRSLQDIQDVLKRMITDIVLLQQRERRLVDHTRATSSRLMYMAVFAILLLVVTSALQFMHFKTYFKSKKLI